MRNTIKRIAPLLRPALLAFCSVFLDRRYLTGRFFDPGFTGYLWALRSILCKNILRLASPRPWPTGLTCTVLNERNISFHPDDLNNFQSPGTYFQNSKASIKIGKGSYIGPNVGIITANHQTEDLDSHEEGQDVILGQGCWIGMNSVVLPGVTLGDGTIVGAGSVVTKSFPDGHVVIAGVPARFLRANS